MRLDRPSAPVTFRYRVRTQSEHATVGLDDLHTPLIRKRLTARLEAVQGNFKWHQYQVVGRLLPTEAQPDPTVFRMKIWAQDEVRARSRFWCAAHGCTSEARAGMGTAPRPFSNVARAHNGRQSCCRSSNLVTLAMQRIRHATRHTVSRGACAVASPTNAPAHGAVRMDAEPAPRRKSRATQCPRVSKFRRIDSALCL